MAPLPGSEDILPHIFLPLPNLNDLPKPTSKEDRLKTIISNLDKQHQKVRLSIISAAKEKLQTPQVALQRQDTGPMELDESEEEGEYHIRGRSLPSQDHAIANLVANLETPYHETMGDLSVRPPRPNGDGQAAFVSPPQPGIRQVTPPPDVQVAAETLATIEKYDHHVKKTRKFYVDALERLTRRNSTGGGSGSWSAGGHHDRKGSGSFGPGPYGGFGNGSLSGGGYRMNASPIDSTRDPRRQQNASPNDPFRDPRRRR